MVRVERDPARLVGLLVVAGIEAAAVPAIGIFAAADPAVAIDVPAAIGPGAIVVPFGSADAPVGVAVDRPVGAAGSVGVTGIESVGDRFHVGAHAPHGVAAACQCRRAGSYKEGGHQIAHRILLRQNPSAPPALRTRTREEPRYGRKVPERGMGGRTRPRPDSRAKHLLSAGLAGSRSARASLAFPSPRRGEMRASVPWFPGEGRGPALQPLWAPAFAGELFERAPTRTQPPKE